MKQLAAFMEEDLGAADIPAGVEPLLEALHERYSNALRAILLYGSVRRRGDARDGLVDLMVLVSGYRQAHRRLSGALNNAALPPNVYYLEAEGPAGRVRCKYALLSLGAFERRCRGGADGYFWARFAQPARCLWSADEASRRAVAAARAQAAHCFAQRVAPLCGERCDGQTFWRRALTLSYGCELRPESPQAAAALIDAERDYWRRLSELVLPELAAITPEGEDRYRFGYTRLERLRARLGWAGRRILGKTLNVLRLFKAAGTFTNGIDYLLWKAERHSGVRVEATEAMRRRPRRAAWRLAWRLWRQGAFR